MHTFGLWCRDGEKQAWANAVLSRSRKSPSSFLSISNEAVIVRVSVEGVRSRNKGLIGRRYPYSYCKFMMETCRDPHRRYWEALSPSFTSMHICTCTRHTYHIFWSCGSQEATDKDGIRKNVDQEAPHYWLVGISSA